MESVAESSYSSGRHNVSFLSSFLLNDVEKCVDILVESGRIPEAMYFAHCYCPSQVPRMKSLWGGKGLVPPIKVNEETQEEETRSDDQVED